MKRLVILILALVFCTVAFAESEWASYSNEELIAFRDELTNVLAGIEAELAQRAASTLAPIILDSSKAGEYGKLIMLNANTDMSYSFIGFYVPSGRYIAKAESSAAQITFYIIDKTTISDGWEYPVAHPDHKPVVIMPDTSAEIIVYPDEYIKLPDGCTVELSRME